PHFLADHPFLFFIKHCESGAVLFVGRINHPKSN
ncbi:serpin family protein, partial [Salmonella sp. s54925]